MTFRCSSSRAKNLAGIALLLMVSALGSLSVSAQDDGASVPPPPKVKPQTDTSPDPEFQSPMKRRQWREQMGGGGDGEQFMPRRMRRMGQGGGFNGPGDGGEGGPGFRRPGFGAGFGGPEMDAAVGGPSGAGRPFGGAGVRSYGGMRRGGGFGGGGGGGFGGGFGHKLDLTPLNLTDDQKAKIKQIRQANRERAKDFRQQLMQKQMALHSLIFSPTATDVQIRAARKEVRKAQDSLEEVGLEDLLQIRGLLTSEQRQRLPQIAPPMPGRQPDGDRTASVTTSARRIEK